MPIVLTPRRVWDGDVWVVGGLPRIVDFYGVRGGTADATLVWWIEGADTALLWSSRQPEIRVAVSPTYGSHPIDLSIRRSPLLPLGDAVLGANNPWGTVTASVNLDKLFGL